MCSFVCTTAKYNMQDNVNAMSASFTTKYYPAIYMALTSFRFKFNFHGHFYSYRIYIWPEASGVYLFTAWTVQTCLLYSRCYTCSTTATGCITHPDMWVAHCLSCICQLINNEYIFHFKTTVQITLIVFFSVHFRGLYQLHSLSSEVWTLGWLM